jgi:hypothetical protein
MEIMAVPRVRVLPYSPYSNSARLLAEALGGKRIKLEGSRYQYRENDVVINWGLSNAVDIISHFTRHMEYPDEAKCLNWMKHLMVRASNKLEFFQHMQGSDWLPKFWTNPEEIPDDAFPIVCRTSLTGHSGHGIVISDSRDDLVPCQLYVKYVPKKEEYRVHLGKNKIGDVTTIAVQQKKRRLDYDEPNWKIRNHANGFVYAREGVDPPAGVLGVTMDCLLRSGLDFGAVDLGWHPEYGTKVYEINTAPGLEGQTLTDYVNFFNQFRRN